MLENGDSQKARFYFSAFRFIEQQNETISTYYLHCITRLCERSVCSTFKVGIRCLLHLKQKSSIPARSSAHIPASGFYPQQCNRKRRSVETTVVQESITEPSVLTVAIKARRESRKFCFLFVKKYH